MTGKVDKPARLEVWRLRDGKRLVLNVQAFRPICWTFVVIPLAQPGSFDRVDEVNPQVEVSGTTYLLVTQQLSSPPQAKVLVDGETRVFQVERPVEDIVGAHVNQSVIQQRQPRVPKEPLDLG